MEKITLSGNWDLIASGPGIITIRSAVAFDYITVTAGTLPSEITGALTHGSDDILSIETVTGQVVYVRGAMGASAFVFADHPTARTQVQIPPAPKDWNWDVRPATDSGNEIVVNRVENATPAIMNIEYTVDGGETAIELPGLVGTHAVPEQKGLDWAYQIRNISGGGQSPWSSVKTPIYGGPVLGISVVPDPLYVGGAFTVTIAVPAGGTLSTVSATAGGTPIALTGSGNTRTGTAPAEAGPLVVTATGTDADGNPLTANRTVQVREEPPSPGDFIMSQLAVSRIYQRATDTGGDFGRGAGVIPIDVTASAATPVYARLRDAVTGDVIKAAWQVGNVTEGASTLDVAGIPARRGRCYVDLAAKAEGPWQEGTTPVAMGAIIAGGGQSQMGYTAYANGAGTLASLGIVVPDDGFISWHARDSADAQDWTDGTWGRPADNGQYTGSFAGQILQDMTTALGVAVGYVGYSRGTTKASDFAAGTADRERLHAQLDMAGGFEAFLWVQGGTDMSSSTPPATFKAATQDVLDSLPAHNAIRGSNFRLIGSATFTRTSSTTVNSNNMRRAVQELMTQLGGTYMDTRDIILTDGIHQSQAGGQRFARHVRRALLGDWQPPVPVSVTKAGAVLTVAFNLSDGATLALTGVPTNKVRVEQAGTALTIASVAASGASLTITLSADPGDADLDVWIYPSPDPSNAAATAIIADNSSPVGRPAQPNYNALIAQAGGGGSSLAVEGGNGQVTVTSYDTLTSPAAVGGAGQITVTNYGA